MFKISSRIVKLFILCIAIALASCDNGSRYATTIKDAPSTPKALKSDERTREGLLDGLYQELENNDTELKKIRIDIEKINEAKADTISPLERFLEKNNTYYTTAGYAAKGIQDSVLRQRILLIITNSQNRCETNTIQIKKAIDQLNQNETSLNDYFLMLKIVRTLPMIEKYQKDNMPQIDSLSVLNKSYDKLINKTKQLSNQ